MSCAVPTAPLASFVVATDPSARSVVPTQPVQTRSLGVPPVSSTPSAKPAGTLIAAQGLGDRASLQKRGRRAIRLHFGDLDDGLARLDAMIAAATGEPARA